MDKNFVHLHLHTQYSLLESMVRIEDLTARAAELKMPAVSMTDHGNLFGAIEFYLGAKKAGLNPIVGCEVYIAPNGRFQKGASTSHTGVKTNAVGPAAHRLQNPQSL